MNVKELIEKIQSYKDLDDMIITSSLNPILDIQITKEPAFIFKNGKFTYDCESNKVNFICCSLEDWISYYVKKNKGGNFRDMESTINYQKNRENYTDSIVNYWMKANTTKCEIDDKVYNLLSTLDPQQKYSLPQDILNKLLKLDGKLECIRDGYPIHFVYDELIYWDGYGRCIENGKFIFGGASFKLMLWTLDEFDFIESIMFGIKTIDLIEILSHFEIEYLPEEKRVKLLEDIKDYCDNPTLKEQINKLITLGDNAEIINMGLGPVVVPKPKGGCCSCKNYSDVVYTPHGNFGGRCSLKEGNSTECNMGDGMALWEKREDMTPKCPKCGNVCEKYANNTSNVCTNVDCELYFTKK